METKISVTKSLCGSMDTASTCGAKSLGFNFYLAQVLVGDFLTARISFYSLLGETNIICPRLLEKRKTPHPDPALCRLLRVSFSFNFLYIGFIKPNVSNF